MTITDEQLQDIFKGATYKVYDDSLIVVTEASPEDENYPNQFTYGVGSRTFLEISIYVGENEINLTNSQKMWLEQLAEVEAITVREQSQDSNEIRATRDTLALQHIFSHFNL